MANSRLHGARCYSQRSATLTRITRQPRTGSFYSPADGNQFRGHSLAAKGAGDPEFSGGFTWSGAIGAGNPGAAGSDDSSTNCSGAIHVAAEHSNAGGQAGLTRTPRVLFEPFA